MKRVPGIIALVLILTTTVFACSGSQENETTETSVDLAGPALVMFYTDN